MQPHDGLAIPRPLHRAIQFLCWFMILWSLAFPMTWLSGVLPTTAWWPGLLQSRLYPRYSLIPLDVTTKYTGHAAVTLTHNLPSAIWSTLVLIQLSPSIRKTRPRLHRFCGYLHAIVSSILMVGVAIMQYQRMYFSMHPAIVWFMQATSAWFLFTLAYAVLAARARLYRAHRAWMLRHVASGIWVAVQRLLVALVLVPLMRMHVVDPATDDHRRFGFGAAFLGSFVLCVTTVEMYLWLSKGAAEKKRR